MMTDLERAQFGCCAITTGLQGTRNRCLNRDPVHRGPHWQNVEVINCLCKFFCYGHPTLYMVGGFVRDELLEIKSKDVDFAVEAESYGHMKNWLERQGFEIFLEEPDYFTIRARFPRVPWEFAKRDMGSQTCDFVLCRKESRYSDGRRPDAVEQGTILDDLSRRDFTVNAMAITEAGEYLDPFGGRNDLNYGILRAVGDPWDRLREDALRALRAIRFQVTKDLKPDNLLRRAMSRRDLPALLASVSADRRRGELQRAFRHNTERTFSILATMPPSFRTAIFADGLWLDPTLRH